MEDVDKEVQSIASRLRIPAGKGVRVWLAGWLAGWLVVFLNAREPLMLSVFF
jgi:hypothetical protein